MARFELDIGGIKVGMNMPTAIFIIGVATFAQMAISFGAMPGFAGFVTAESLSSIGKALETLGGKIDALEQKNVARSQALDKKIDQVATDTRAYVIRGNIIAMHSRQCDAHMSGNPALERNIADQVSDLNDEYEALTGRRWMVNPCP
jgi:hypothetical protein